MERERELQLHQLQADLCHVLADPTRLELLHVLGERSQPVKALIEITGQRQSKISQHLAVLRQRGLVCTERRGTEIHYSLTNQRILQACQITREVMLQRLIQQAMLAMQSLSSEEE